MARKKSSEDRQARSLKSRHVPFTGLLAAVPVTFLGWWMLHLAVRGDTVVRVLWTLIVLVAGAGLAALAWGISSGRRTLVRGHVATSVGLSFAGGAGTVAAGYPRWWLLTYAVLGAFLAVSWMLYRLDSLRADKGEGDGEDDLKAELGLKHVRFNRAKQFFDKDGELTRVEVPIKLTRGATVETVQGALGSLESVANSVRARGRVVGGDTAQEAHMTLIMKDMLQHMVPWPGPSAPGACITEPIVDSVYEDQQPSFLYLAGNHPAAPNPSSRGIMGMTRVGKTMVAQIDAMEMMTRRRVAILWFDSVKGAQTVAPLRAGFEVVVADDTEGDPQLFKAGLKAGKRLIMDRAKRLGEAGFRQWTPEAADLLNMPLAYWHFEEADVLIAQDAGDDMVFMASKGLSAGVVGGWSLQRPDAVNMPTNLRFNIGTWDCFGCGDAVTVGMALSDWTINSGAHPEYWKQSKPGYFYREGMGIDMDRWPVLRKGFIASDEEMAAHTAEWAPRMDRLGDRDVEVLGDWYQRMQQLMAQDTTGEVGATMPLPNPSGNGNRPVTTFVIDGVEDEDARERREFHDHAESEIAEMRESGEIPRDEEDPEMSTLDPSRSLEPDPPGTPEVTWTNPPEPPSKEEAERAFDRALFELAADATLWDAGTGEVVFQVGTLADRYKFRTRPWFSSRLSAVVEGTERVTDPSTGRPANLTLERGEKRGQYRMRLQRQLEPSR